MHFKNLMGDFWGDFLSLRGLNDRSSPPGGGETLLLKTSPHYPGESTAGEGAFFVTEVFVTEVLGCYE